MRQARRNTTNCVWQAPPRAEEQKKKASSQPAKGKSINIRCSSASVVWWWQQKDDGAKFDEDNIEKEEKKKTISLEGKTFNKTSAVQKFRG